MFQVTVPGLDELVFKVSLGGSVPAKVKLTGADSGEVPSEFDTCKSNE
jgi:hypothetical protein